MGAQNSTPAVHGRIDAVIPHHPFELTRGIKNRGEVVNNLTPLFSVGSNDRGQFIHSLRILLSANGQLSLADKRFRLVFSRAPEEFSVAGEEQEQIYVSLVATDADGNIAAKVTSDRAGTDHYEAFGLFRKTVEMRMHEMLDSIPEPGQIAASSSTNTLYAQAQQGQQQQQQQQQLDCIADEHSLARRASVLPRS